MKKRKFRIPLLILIGLDLVSKYVFYDLEYLSHNSFLTPVLNTGISRSLPLPYMIIILVSIVGIGAIIFGYTKKYIGHLITIFLLAGTTGNLIDRLVFHGVRDFIDIGIFNFPIFNIADIMLSIGVGIRILQIILEKKK